MLVFAQVLRTKCPPGEEICHNSCEFCLFRNKAADRQTYREINPNALPSHYSHRGVCRMKMLPVVILAKYYSSALSAVSKRPNLNARLVSQMSQLERDSFLSVQYYNLGRLTVQLILNIPKLLLAMYSRIQL